MISIVKAVKGRSEPTEGLGRLHERGETKMSTFEDAELVQRYQHGDESALDTLVKIHQEWAYRFAFRLCRDSENAADIVADAFVRVCKSLHKFQGNCAFKSWLYRIITNSYLDMRKKGESRKTVSFELVFGGDGAEYENEPVGQLPSPHEFAVRNELKDRLTQAIEELPEHQRVIIVMHYLQMLPYEEICEILELPIGTVKSKLNRARTALRESLLPEMESLVAA
jgi:RNA polymerase sigma-70 factor (ECF subfamily)